MLITAQARRRGLDPGEAASMAIWARLGYRIRAGERGLLRPSPILDDTRYAGVGEGSGSAALAAP